MRRTGILRSWHCDSGWGIISTSFPQMERFFMHVSGIRTSPCEPKPGMRVQFEISSEPPRKPGGLPIVCNADLTDASTNGEGGAK